MSYRILLIEKEHIHAAGTRDYLKHCRFSFDVDLACPENVDKSRYTEADCVVAHLTTGLRMGKVIRRRPQGLIRLRMEFPNIPLILAPLGHANGKHSEPKKDDDGVVYFSENFTQEDLVEAAYREIKRRC